MKTLHPALFALSLLALAACAGPVTMAPQGDRLAIMQEAAREKEIAFKRIIEDQDRLFGIAFPILAANATFCRGHTTPSLGMTLWNEDTVRPEYRPAAAGLYNLHERLAAQHVAAGSPAARAGIRSGDFIVAINRRNIPAGRDGIRAVRDLLRAAAYNQVEILTERKGGLINTVMQPVEICDYPLTLDSSSNDINAFTDGQRIYISKGILRFTENDNELALVIAHELGHIAMSHVGKQQQNAMVGAGLGLAIDSLLAAAGVNTGNQVSQMGQALGAQRFSVAFEQEADYVGMYFMERAGYDSARVADFWRRMAAEMPAGVSVRTSHPTSPERFLAIERAHGEIAAKKKRGETLIPNFKKD